MTPSRLPVLGAWLVLLVACSTRDPLSSHAQTSDQTSGAQTTGAQTSITVADDVTTLGEDTTWTDETAGASEDGGVDDTGCSFWCPGDGGVVGFQCDVWGQDCPDGHKCTWWNNEGGLGLNATKCVPVASEPVGPGESCVVEEYPTSGLDDCELGSLCMGAGLEDLTGKCIPLCAGTEINPQCPGDDRKCSISASGPALCLETCHPLDAPCGPGRICVHVAFFMCLPDASGDDGAYGDPCEQVDECSPGLLCAAAASVPGCEGASGCCSEFCDLSDDEFACAGADGGQACIPWYEQGLAPPGFDTLGACVIPR
jgi:hypothetical protein